MGGRDLSICRLGPTESGPAHEGDSFMNLLPGTLEEEPADRQ